MAGPTQNSRCWIDKAVSKKALQARDIVVEKKRWESSVTAAAAISHKGCIGPRIIGRGVEINAIVYSDVAQNVYAPGMAFLYGGVGKFAFTQDNAPPHTVSGARRYPNRGSRVKKSSHQIPRNGNSLSAGRWPVKLGRIGP